VKFWSAGAEPVQMIADGEAHLGIAWNGRIKKMQDDGVEAVMVWTDANTDSSRYGIPVGCENKKAAETYLSAWANPEWVANWSNDIPYPGFVPGVMERLDPEYAKQMPTHPDNVAKSYLTNWTYWEKNRERLEERWKEWLLE
jgi:putative spermidine/putrescine transport system substrate-binding protein